jgi:hypothetical protein
MLVRSYRIFMPLICIKTTIRYLCVTVVMRCLLYLLFVLALGGPGVRKQPVLLVRGKRQPKVRRSLRVLVGAFEIWI